MHYFHVPTQSISGYQLGEVPPTLSRRHLAMSGGISTCFNYVPTYRPGWDWEEFVAIGISWVEAMLKYLNSTVHSSQN